MKSAYSTSANLTQLEFLPARKNSKIFIVMQMYFREKLSCFVYLDEFLDDWRQLYGNDPDDLALWPLEHLIMSNPLSGDKVQGTGGLRKLRFGSDDTGNQTSQPQSGGE